MNPALRDVRRRLGEMLRWERSGLYCAQAHVVGCPSYLRLLEMRITMIVEVLVELRRIERKYGSRPKKRAGK